MNHRPSSCSQPVASVGALVQESYPQEPSTEISWQSALFDALIERNRIRSVLLVRRAQCILENRLAEVMHGQSGDPAEVIDLRASLAYLDILLNCEPLNKENCYGIEPCECGGFYCSDQNGIA